MVYHFNTLSDLQEKFEVKENIVETVNKITKIFSELGLEFRFIPFGHQQVMLEIVENNKGLELEVINNEKVSYLIYNDPIRYSKEEENLPFSQELIHTIIEKYQNA